jgi:tetratricopeptide (TPR) repeat protein
LNPTETEDRAWTLVQIGHLLNLRGETDDAGRVLENALELMPDYHYALAGLAQVRSAEGRYEDAVKLFRRRYELAPHPENLFDLGVALRNAGKFKAAKAALAEFERRALEESAGWDNANRELVTYYVDYKGQPESALRIAEREIVRRRDVFTLDAYAWALHRNGRSREAIKHSQSALAVGSIDPTVLYHAGVIAIAAGEPETARKHLERSLEVNGRSAVASAARRALQHLPRQTKLIARAK